MAKAVKKKGKNRRLKRSIRKTLGAMFLASALAVAAIPTEGLQAADGDADGGVSAQADVPRPHTDGLGGTDPMKVSIAPLGTTGAPAGWSVSQIPDITDKIFNDKDLNGNQLTGQGQGTIYTSENLNLRFAIANIRTENAYAVIVGYNNQQQASLPQDQRDTLTIPETVDAYTLYKGYSCAIGGNHGEILFYKAKIGEDPTVSDSDGNPQPIYEYRPCSFKDIDIWKSQEYDQETNPTGGLWYVDGFTSETTPGFVIDPDGVPTSIPNGKEWRQAQSVFTERIKDIKVWYIANQYVDTTDTMTSAAKNVDSSHGIFTGATVGSLVVEPSLIGIGDYAFAGMQGIKRVELSNTIKEIGNHAFNGCSGISEFKIDDNANGVVIGDHAFYNCAALYGFDAKGVSKIGDSAFEGCTNLRNFNLLSGEELGLLTNLGYYAFAACSNLQEIVFPRGFTETDVPISTFMRCSGLKRICATGSWPAMNLVEDDYYTFENFHNECNPGFYFEGARGNGPSALENTAIDNYFAYKYLGEEVYKKKIPDETSKHENGRYERNATFEVSRVGQTDVGEITDVELDPGLQNLEIPGVIGPLSVTTIGESGFADTCSLTSVVIPPTITSIGANAFKGCHNLNSVIFEDASRISRQNMGTDAFATQSLGTGHIGCTLSNDPELYFTGEIRSDIGPFQYAMDKDIYISAGTQTPSHITYYSGWPSNLTVENRDGVATLTNYPTIKQLMRGTLAPAIPSDEYFNNANYPYFTMDGNYELAAYVAFYKYFGMTDAATANTVKSVVDSYIAANKDRYPEIADYTLDLGSSLNGYEQQIVGSTLNVQLPEGIVAIEEGLFGEKEAKGDYEYLQKQNLLKGGTVSDGDTAGDHLESVNNQPLGKTFTVNLEDISDESFADCKMLETIYIGNGTKEIGDYAFRDCSYLQNVFVDQNLEEMGLVPFIGCNKLAQVSFNNNPNFSCEESVLFGRASDGTVSKIIEYLNGADYQLPSKEALGKATEIAEEAFRDTKIQVADFSQSTITEIPRYAFANTASLTSVTLPHTMKAIRGFAFEDSAINYLYGIPSSLQTIESTAFDGVPSGGSSRYCTFYSPEGAYAQDFSDNNKDHPNLKWQKDTEIAYYTIHFYYEDENGEKVIVHTEENVKTGDSVDVEKLFKEGAFDQLPKEINGQVFKRVWQPKSSYTNVSGSTNPLEARAVYGEADKHTVTFLDKDNNVIWSNEVFVGGNIYIPTAPAVAGMTFSGWESLSPGLPGTYKIEDLDTIEVDVTFRAVYTPNGGGTGSGNNPGGNEPGGNTPGGNTPGGNTPGTGSGNGSGNDPGNGTGSGNGSGTNTGNYYTLTVVNGNGSGSYVEGTQAIISANEPANGMEFSNWTIDPADTKIASTGMSATVITMPAVNVTVTAHYRAKTGSSTGSGNTSSANASRRPNNTGTVSNGGTTVVIDKNGISNTGVVAATVNGSSDNFVIKITENSAASEAVVRALMAEYGSLDNIKYFPMDISLYDSTGTNKITDTTGLSVDITLPIPDSLITYAGNNKVAGVVNDRLDKLSAKFTTISGVSCITFRAEHFSPYVIYVDTANLSAGESADSTPKTGDGIHPKWFLSIGLACLSFVMFMQKDKRKPQKVKAKA